jgi:hypothetical protein
LATRRRRGVIIKLVMVGGTKRAGVSRNPDVIDLEMSLPAYSEAPEERRAPRMDLVGIEPIGDRWRVVFWEAKLVGDGRARCLGKTSPGSSSS